MLAVCNYPALEPEFSPFLLSSKNANMRDSSSAVIFPRQVGIINRCHSSTSCNGIGTIRRYEFRMRTGDGYCGAMPPYKTSKEVRHLRWSTSPRLSSNMVREAHASKKKAQMSMGILGCINYQYTFNLHMSKYVFYAYRHNPHLYFCNSLCIVFL